MFGAAGDGSTLPCGARAGRASRECGALLASLLAGVLAWPVAAGGAALAASEAAGRPVDFAATDGGQLSGRLYGAGDAGAVLAHGKVFDQTSFEPLARRLAAAGRLTLTFDFRGYGASRPGHAGAGGLEHDVLGAVGFLAGQGCRRVAVVGASMGGAAAGRAAALARPGEIERLVLLAPAPLADPAAMRAGSILFIASEGEAGLPRIRADFAAAPEPKRLELLPGAAHAQHVFKTDQAERLAELIVAFLSAAAP